MPHLRPADVTFFELKNTVFCVQCELMSYNSGSHCLACGSTALLTLARVLGGSLRREHQVRVISDDAIDRVVEGILERSNPINPTASVAVSVSENSSTALQMPSYTGAQTLPGAPHQLEPAMRWIVERACTITQATGAALALSQHGRLICQAHAGSSVPDLGVELDLTRGISGLCARTGRSWRCNSVELDPHVDRARCRDLGTQSIVAAPISHLNQLYGVLEVFSQRTNAFTNHHVARLQLLAGLLVVAISRAEDRPGSDREQSRALLTVA